jgi:NAD(P)-dependent dehydrogenase (short-subunit alcohol dehydrogenase family)
MRHGVCVCQPLTGLCFTLAGGIGRHLVRSFLGRGGRVVCLDVCIKSLEHLEAWLSEAERQRATFFQMDATSTAEIRRAAEFVRREVGPVDVLINNAGIFNKGKLFLELSESEMRNIFDINILGQMFMCRQFLPDMLQRNSGHIVNMVSEQREEGG